MGLLLVYVPTREGGAPHSHPAREGETRTTTTTTPAYTDRQTHTHTHTTPHTRPHTSPSPRQPHPRSQHPIIASQPWSELWSWSWSWSQINTYRRFTASCTSQAPLPWHLRHCTAASGPSAAPMRRPDFFRTGMVLGKLKPDDQPTGHPHTIIHGCTIIRR